MAYTKMTVADFRQRLKEDHYSTATGARRAIGKADLPDSEKAKGYAAINKHFGEDAKPTPAKPAKAAPFKAGTKKKVLAAKKAKKAPKDAPKDAPAATKKAATKKVPVKKAPAKKKKAASKKGAARAAEAAAEEGATDALGKLHLANERIGTIVQAIQAMAAAKEAYPDLDTSKLGQSAGDALTDIVVGVHNTAKGEQMSLPNVDPKILEGLAATASASHGLPGQVSPVQIPPMAQEPQPPAVQ